MSGGEWIDLGSVPRRYRVTWCRTLWDTAGARFWWSIGAAMIAALAGLVLGEPIVIALAAAAALLLVAMWLAVTTSEYRRHRDPGA
jgi:hypothetical protein